MNTTPARIGKFQILKRIGKGSMASVYQAYDPFMARHVAIKVTDPRMLPDERTRRRLTNIFFSEAKICGMLDHGNILPVYDAGQDGELYYLVMEFIESSRTLYTCCAKDSLLPVPKAVEILYQCCKGLQYAHDQKVLHLDIKPNNIMLAPDDQVKITDFGIAKLLSPDADALHLEHIHGALTYLPPERLRKEPVNYQADIYSLGVVAYFLLTGRLPFDSTDLKELVRMILKEEPPPLRRMRPDIPDTMEPIIRKALAKHIKQRYVSMSQMAADLNALHKQLMHTVITSDIGARAKLDRLKRLPFFKDFFETELVEVIAASEWLEYESGRMILAEKELDESFYVIVAGEASVERNESRISTLKAGDCFGEMAYVSRRPREVGIRSAGGVTVLKIDNDVLERLSVYCQLKFTKEFLNRLIMRLSHITRS